MLLYSMERTTLPQYFIFCDTVLETVAKRILADELQHTGIFKPILNSDSGLQVQNFWEDLLVLLQEYYLYHHDGVDSRFKNASKGKQTGDDRVRSAKSWFEIIEAVICQSLPFPMLKKSISSGIDGVWIAIDAGRRVRITSS